MYIVSNFKRISILRLSAIGNQTTKILSNFVKKDFEKKNAADFLFVFYKVGQKSSGGIGFY